jgi:hypothetical protein
MRHTAINVALFCGILAAMVGIQHLDSKGYEHEVAREEMAKQAREARFERAAREVCGENGSYTVTSGTNQIVCKTKRGHKTGRVASL